MDLTGLEQLKRVIHQVPEEKLIETFSKGALKLDDEQIKTVSFVFWLCYMAETDLNEIIKQAWDMAQKAYPVSDQEAVNKVIKDMGFDFEKLEYFSQKIGIYEKMFGKIERTKILWKINTIRNDLSHNRIESLSYNGKRLTLRETKEQIVIDYFETSQRSDFSKSKIWNGLTAEQQKEIEKLAKGWLNENNGKPDLNLETRSQED